MDRRNFIVRSVRWLLAGSMAGMTGFLVYRERIGNPSDCYINPYCARCKENKSCGIVAEARQKQNEEDTGK